MAKIVNHPHAGHRQRLKDKVRNSGLNILQDHEVLELLLTYTIPRKDTNELAHNILNRFGSLSKSVDADYSDLKKINGVGEETALFFKILSELIARYKEDKLNELPAIVRSTGEGVLYFRQRFSVGSAEDLYVICTDKKGAIVNTFIIEGKDELKVQFDLREFLDKINLKKTSNIMVFHTHPKGDVKPTVEDLEATRRMIDLCRVVGVNFADHIILNEYDHHSMSMCGELEKILKNSKAVTPSIMFDPAFFNHKKEN